MAYSYLWGKKTKRRLIKNYTLQSVLFLTQNSFLQDSPPLLPQSHCLLQALSPNPLKQLLFILKKLHQDES